MLIQRTKEKMSIQSNKKPPVKRRSFTKQIVSSYLLLKENA